ncbi:MAG TPA: DUF5715 family protein [Candidatus Paceibacterota bacterium]|nr:DUF5715 family protein [Candidatus Paceibacterota bacterium]
MRKLLALIIAMMTLLVFTASEADAREKQKPKVRKTQKHLSVPMKKYVKPKPRREVPGPPSFSEPKGPLITKEMLTRVDRAGIKNVEIYHECMRSEDPIEQVIRFFHSAKTRVSIVGSNEGIAYELCAIDAYGIERFQTVNDIDRAKGRTLFPVMNKTVAKDDDLDGGRYVASPWVHEYLVALSEDYREAMIKLTGREPEKPYFTISSIVRSMDIQRLQWNSPARCLREGGLCSSHTTGTTFDIGLANVTQLKKNTLASLLQDDRRSGVVYFNYERRPGPHFHVFVYPPALRDGLRDYAERKNQGQTRPR